MSKIYEAFRKRVGDLPDLTVELGRVGTIALYPMPDATQLGEFSQLANRLLDHKPEDRGAAIAFASTAASEGASFVSYNAALLLATVYHQKVCWVDANFQSPQKALAHAEGPTLAMLLQNPERLYDLKPVGNPTLVPGGLNLQAVRGLFADQKGQDLMHGFRAKFDFVIVDMPPVQSTTDTALMATVTDGLTLVIEQRCLKREVIGHGLEALRSKGVDVIGAVINKRSYDLPQAIYDRL